jgi:hypothetical protein
MADSKALIKDGFAIGDPDDVIGALKQWESTGVDGVMFLINSNEIIPQKDVLDSLRLFATEVMPHFKRDGEQEKRRTVSVRSSDGESALVGAGLTDGAPVADGSH